MSFIKILLTLLVSCSLMSCGSGVTVRMNESVPPSFTFSQNGSHVDYLDFFVVLEIAPENVRVKRYDQDRKKNVAIWKVWPKGNSEGTLSNLPPITYGRVPEGFTQEIPTEGAPPALMEGKVYQAGGPEVSMPDGVIRFIIRNGKAVELPIPE
jgi:hypothetical protein